jgi:hypothetical protein
LFNSFRWLHWLVGKILYRAKKARGKPAPTKEFYVIQLILFLFAIKTRHKVGATGFGLAIEVILFSQTRKLANSQTRKLANS